MRIVRVKQRRRACRTDRVMLFARKNVLSADIDRAAVNAAHVPRERHDPENIAVPCERHNAVNNRIAVIITSFALQYN
jgi:hypothetical protein